MVTDKIRYGGRSTALLSTMISRAMIVVSSVGLSNGCASVSKDGTSENRLSTQPSRVNVIHWPRAYRPEDVEFFVYSAIDIAAPPQFVWNVIAQAETWPIWYAGARNVDVANSNTGRLESNAVFTWTTMDLDFTSTVAEFEPPYRLSWESRKSTISLCSKE